MVQNITVGTVDNPGGPGMEWFKCSSAGLCHLRTTVRAVGLTKQKVFCLSPSLALSLSPFSLDSTALWDNAEAVCLFVSLKLLCGTQWEAKAPLRLTTTKNSNPHPLKENSPLAITPSSCPTKALTAEADKNAQRSPSYLLSWFLTAVWF